MPKAYLIAHFTISDPEPWARLSAAAKDIFARHGGRYLARSGRERRGEGRLKHEHAIIEFPDFAAANAAFDDPDMEAIRNQRRIAGFIDSAIVEGVDE